MKIGITLGDPSGIGPELILKAIPKVKNSRSILIFGSRKILKKTASDLHILNNYKKIEDKIVDCVSNVKFQYGVPSKKTGWVAIQSIDSTLKQKLDIVVTPPIVKDVIRYINPGFIGHTEYFAEFFNARNFAMVGLVDNKRIMLLTTHMPLRKVFENITTQGVAKKIALLDWGLKMYFNTDKPSIAVCSVNPHSFEFSLGEDEIINRAILHMRKKGINASGPYPADSIFDRRFDGFLAMYHDQAMIYLKSKKNGLNFTVGLPIIRLSPLYGAALDIAGRNKAETSGLITAIRQGIKIYKNVRRNEKKKIRI
jgi:4-hydroxythreonine-4-phosphate dehydrogenase